VPSIPLTPDEERKVLSLLGIQSADDLFSTIPPAIREKATFRLDLGDKDDGTGRGLTEHELRDFFGALAKKNWHLPEKRHFLGGGIYDNIIPAIVNQLVLRGEFLTCYTPYQPEISQGTLQAIFEFQTMIARMTGMPVANASMYDGATATSEAILMAQRLASAKQQNVLMADSTHPEYRAVCETFLGSHSTIPVGIPWDEKGTVNTSALAELIRVHHPCAVVIPSPNYFGILEPLEEIKTLLPKNCLLIVTVPDPSVFALFEAPGNLGADIVVGEAHQLGTPMLFGGPHVGFFASKREYLRQMPGRLAGETTDKHGKRAYTLTLATREQHIRREKATSNICTNQGLIALRTTIYLSFLGKEGFRNLGEWNFSMFEYLSKELSRVGIPLQFKGPHYREGVFRSAINLRMQNLNSPF
jgi:glycine dehydrogenase subunit 1